MADSNEFNRTNDHGDNSKGDDGGGLDPATKSYLENKIKELDAWQANMALQAGLYRYRKQEFEEAAGFFRYAADRGNSSAMFNLGTLHYNGEGVEQSIEEAVKWYRRALNAGDMRAVNCLAYIYKNCYGDEQDVKEELEKELEEDENVKKDHQSAKNDDPDAKSRLGSYYFRLGCRYFNGDGVKLNVKKAVICWRFAADADNTDGMFELGKYYSIFCRDDEQTLKEAFSLLQRAANLGHVGAMISLANSLFKGDGCDRNQNEAIEWYRRAADAGDEVAKALLTTLNANR